MSTAKLGQITAFGRHMKQWRRQRGLSQLELAIRADVSQRYVSFIETGRSRPKANVVHKVTEALEVPIRERNVLLEAAGLAPSYPEVSLYFTSGYWPMLPKGQNLNSLCQDFLSPLRGVA